MRHAQIASLLLISACKFTTHTPVVSSSHVTQPLEHALTVSTDASTLYLVDEYPVNTELVGIDAATGAFVSAFRPFYTSHRPVALAPSPTYADGVIALTRGGGLMEFDSNLSTWSNWLGIPTTPSSVTSRTYCDVDTLPTGEVYVTLTEQLSYGWRRAVLYRRSPAGSWSSQYLPGRDCTLVSTDNVQRAVFVGVPSRGEIRRYDPSSLAFVSTMTLPSGFKDLSSEGSAHVIAASTNRLQAYDHAGVLMDTGPQMMRADAVHVHPASGGGRAWWSGQDSPNIWTAGWDLLE